MGIFSLDRFRRWWQGRTQDIAGHFKEIAVGVSKQTIVSDLLEVFGQHMLQEAMDEIKRRQGFEIPRLGFGILAAEGDLVVINRNETVIGDGNPEDIAGQIDGGLPAGTDRFAMHDPVFLPDLAWDQVEQFGFFQFISELGLEDGGDQFNPDQEVVPPGGKPLTVVRTQAAGRDQVMDMRVIATGFVPGMKHPGHADFTTYEARIAGQF